MPRCGLTFGNEKINLHPRIFVFSVVVRVENPTRLAPSTINAVSPFLCCFHSTSLSYIFLFIINFSKIGLINTFLTRKRDYCLVKFTRKQGYCLVEFTRKQDYLGCKDTKNIVSRKIMSHYFAQNGVKTLFRAE